MLLLNAKTQSIFTITLWDAYYSPKFTVEERDSEKLINLFKNTTSKYQIRIQILYLFYFWGQFSYHNRIFLQWIWIEWMNEWMIVLNIYLSTEVPYFYLCLVLHYIITFIYSLFPALTLSYDSVFLLSKMILWQTTHIKPQTLDDPWSISFQILSTWVATQYYSLLYIGYTYLTKIYLILNLFIFILFIKRIFIWQNSFCLGLSNR